MSFIEQLQTELKTSIDRILGHPFLKRINDASLTAEQLQFFTGQYSIYNNYFPRLLCALAANIDDDKTRFPLIENLWDEHGQGNTDDSHRLLFERFALSTGLSKKELENVQALSSTSICCEHLLSMCKSPDYLTGLGALGPGTEYFTNDEYLQIVEGLSKYPHLGEEELQFWIVHISLDQEHYSEMMHVIEPLCNTEESRQRVRMGAKKAIDLELLFWDGLEKELFSQHKMN